MNEKWFALDIAQVEKKLKTNAASGLSRKAARSRENANAGHLFYVPRKPIWKLILNIFSDFSLIILLLGAIFSLFFETDAVMRGITVLVLAGISLVVCLIFYLRSQRMMESLSSFFYPTARVIRNGRLFHVDFRSVVAGDVILLEKGDVVCCDARLVTSDKLKVKMRLDADTFVSVDKDANVNVDSRENRALKMSNMIHGGSLVESGSARAIVTAVGKYTYLGALTGGFALDFSNKSSKLLINLRKQFSKINFILLISVIPYCVISILFGNLIAERDSFLSAAFLTALAIASTTLSQLFCTVFELFYTFKIRKLVTARDPIVFKSTDAFDRLKNTDYVFLLDGCAVTDGQLHFEIASCSEGEIRNYNKLNPTATSFAEYISLYYSAATNSLTTGVSSSGGYLDGIKEFVEKTRIDTNALKIRCEVKSYTPGNMLDIPETMCFLDRGIGFTLNASRSVDSFKACKFTMLGGEWRNLSEEGIKNFVRVWKQYEAKGLTPIIFTLSSKHNSYASACFLGMVVLKEGVDNRLEKNIFKLQSLGCNVISFVGGEDAPKLPPMLTRDCASKNDFIRSRFPLSYKFGNIKAYSDFENKDIIELISFAHANKKRVAVVGFTDNSLEIAEYADCFISCAAIRPFVSGYLDEEIHTSESVGQQGSTNCSFTVKECADCLLPRPTEGKGGLSSLINAMLDIKSVYNNISDYIRYMISVSLITAVIVGIPMLLGDVAMDAQHVILGALAVGTLSLFAFMFRSGSGLMTLNKDYCSVRNIKDYFVGDLAILVSSLAASLCAILVPWIINFADGKYATYKTEVLFTSFLMLLTVVFVSVYYANNPRSIKNIYRNFFMIAEILFIFAFWLLCFLLDGFGALFGVVNFMPIHYFLITLLPTAIYSVLFVLLGKKSRRSVE